MIITGEEALAQGALLAGVRLVTGYPGSPSSGTFESLLGFADGYGLDIEWSSNERVALETAIGASIAGNRALVCVKSVGMNVMLDTMMALNLTPVNGGLVILLGDDPGGYGSQNDQDTRPLASMMEFPMVEPSSPSEALDMMRELYDVSEKENTVPIIRITRSFAQSTMPFNVLSQIESGMGIGFTREEYRFVPVPINVVKKHEELHDRVDRLRKWTNESDYNRVSGNGTTGIIAAGFVYEKLMQATGPNIIEHAQVLKLGTLFPLPVTLLVDFLGSVDIVLILEETEPYLETLIRAVAQQHNIDVDIRGALDGAVSRTGELFRWEIQRAVGREFPEPSFPQSFGEADEFAERPKKKNHCADSRYDELLDLLERMAHAEGLLPLFVADPGCFVSVADRLTAKYSIGSAVAVSDGMIRSGIDGFPIAILGDSGFFHSSVPAICNVTHRGGEMLIIIADNRSALASGGQPHPGSAADAAGRPARALSIEDLCRSSGIDHMWTVNLDDKTAPSIISSAIRESGVRAVRIIID